jgi:poly(3-hydroxyalkanoate) depolymerase
MQIQYVNIGGYRIRVAVWPGDATSTPLLLLNGIGGNIELLRPFAEQFSGTEMITFDVPGVGGSATTLLPYRLSDLARLVSRLIVQLGYEQVDALGVSWGGLLAQQFAHSFPARCRRLILAATSSGAFAVPGNPYALLMLAEAARHADPSYLARHAGAIFGGVFRDNPDYVLSHINEIMPPRTLGYLWQIIAATGWTSMPWLYTLRQPTLIMAGRDDPLVPAINARIMKYLIPDARLAILDCGHLFLMTQGELVTAVVRSFLAGKLHHDIDTTRDPLSARRFPRNPPPAQVAGTGADA